MAHEMFDDVVSNPAVMVNEVQESEFVPTSTGVRKATQARKYSAVVEKLDSNKLRKLHIGLVLALVMISALFLAVVALSVALSVSELNSSGSDQLNAIEGRLDALSQQLLQSGMQVGNPQANMQLLQEIANRIQLVNSSLEMLSVRVNSSLEMFFQDSSAANNMMRQDFLARIQSVNSSLEMFSQQLAQDILAIDNRTQQVNASLELLSQQLSQDISAIGIRTQQFNSLLEMFSQELAQNISTVDTRTQQDFLSFGNRLQLVNSSLETLSQQQVEDISAVSNRMLQVNASLEQLAQDILSIGYKIRLVNSSLTEDILAIDSAMQQLNSSLELLTQQLVQVNSSLHMLSQQLFQDISAADNRTQQVNISLSDQVNDMLDQIQQVVADLEALGRLETFPAPTCAAIHPSLPSGHYLIRASDGSTVSMFCDMSLNCSGVVGGWTRVVDLDFRDNASDPCPGSLINRTDSDIRTCVAPDSLMSGCASVEHSVSGITYSSVCGKIIGYQIGSPEAFTSSIFLTSLTVSGQYLDGISLTHGNPMKHIWSFAAGVNEARTDRFGCPCNVGGITLRDNLIGTDYFCDSAQPAAVIAFGVFYPNNPLWDGEGCGTTSNCCSFNDPPWFYKQLPQPTSDDIEMRVCRDESANNEGVAIESIELYVR